MARTKQQARKPKAKKTFTTDWVAGGEVDQNNEIEFQPRHDEMDLSLHASNDTEVIEEPKEEPSPGIQGTDGKVSKKYKPDPRRKNAILRKALHPRSAIQCLNELQTGLVWDVQSVAPVGSFCASVEVNGQFFRGYGSNKMDAKNAAAESALVSFVRPPPPKPEPGQDPSEIEDETPWKSLASFAIHKMFTQWSEGKVGQPQGEDLRQYIGTETGQIDTPFNSNISLHLNVLQSSTPQAAQPQVVQPQVYNPAPKQTQPQKPAKDMTDDAKRTFHPSMVLNQLCPGLQFVQSEDLSGGFRNYTMTTTIDDTPYAGQGPSVKKAKFALAKLILKEAYGIDNEYEAK